MAGAPEVATPGGGMFSASTGKGFKSQLKKVYTWYTGGFVAFVLALAGVVLATLPVRTRALR